MRVELKTPALAVEPRMRVQYEQGLLMALRPGWVEVGQRRSEMKKVNVEAGEMGVWGPSPYKVWLEAHVERLILTISDPALRAANDGINGDVELRVVDRFADERLGALVAAFNAGFPSGRLFLDWVEQALAVTLVNNYAVRRPLPRIYRGGLTLARLRRVVELVHAEMDGDLSPGRTGGRSGVEQNPLLTDVPRVNGAEPVRRSIDAFEVLGGKNDHLGCKPRRMGMLKSALAQTDHR